MIQDLEAHHPGISSLDLPAGVAAAWKERLRTVAKTTTTRDGQKLTVEQPRLNYQECLIPVRAFYMDLAQWAAGEPARWGPWVTPCPVNSSEVTRRKARRRLKSRIDARTRERLPVLPVLVGSVTGQRATTEALLSAASNTPPGATFTTAGQTLTRAVIKRPALTAGKIWVHDSATGTRRDLTLEEDHAFWAWATVQTLRLTGIRIEELLQLSHHSLVQYRLPSTGEIVPLLQIVPSKTDTERLLLVSPELADVLSAVIRRSCDHTGKLPHVVGYDEHERAFLPPAPLLFQRRHGTETTAIGPDFIRNILATALDSTGIKDTSGAPLRYTPHDFRRIFITDAILSGLPPHIAQVIAGHRDINVTLGYKAIYPEESIQAHLAFLTRRRALRPGEEYRVPTDDEWSEFLGHFEKRKVSTGTCGRALGTPCIHEHACLRCPMLWPDPGQRSRIAEIRDNLTARIAEAQAEGWLGEVEGLKISLTGAGEKLAQIDRRSPATTDLGIPAIRTHHR